MKNNKFTKGDKRLKNLSLSVLKEYLNYARKNKEYDQASIFANELNLRNYKLF